MDIKKLMIIGLVLIALTASLTAISADDNEKTVATTKVLVDNNLTINNISFTIPDGYEEVESETESTEVDDGKLDTEDIDGTAVDSIEAIEFKNAAGDEIEIKVGVKANNEKIEKISPANFEEKSIADKEGYLLKETDDGKEKYKFEYLEDGKLVKIVAGSEDIISQLLA